MIPWLRRWQLVKGVFGEDRVELVEVRKYAFIISRLRVLSEALRKTLRDCGGRADLFCLREEACRPNAIAFFKRFVREVAVRRAI